MKKHWMAAAVLILAAVVGFMYWNSDTMKDRRVWNRFRAQLTTEQVTKIEVSGAAKTATLSDSEMAEVLQLLRAASFDRSNRVGHGPTPVGTITLTFADGRRQHVSIHGTESFELAPRHLDPGTQFFIRSRDLGAWLKVRFQGPSIG
ncbi:MAG TPA: hypothetical protein VD902_22305 [Symbiobacteriaceae bacterium]|nr:hypothetical protein [Symbiobacteriaceae bacterium]